MAIDFKPLTPSTFVINLAIKNQSELEKVSTQIATSNQHQDFKGYAGDGSAERLISFKETLSNVENYVTANTIIKARLDTMNQSVQKIQDIAANFAQLITLSRNAASGSDIPLAVQGEAALDSIAAQLNVKFDGRYLFSGSKTDTAAVSDLNLNTNLNSSNEPTDNYYQGDSSPPSIKVSDFQDVSYGVLANDPAFQKLIGAINLAMDGHAAGDDTKLAAAFDMVDDAINGLTAVRANIIASTTSVTDATEIHRSVDLTITENIKNISSTDIVEATTTMSNLQALVQATYIAYNRLSQLKLSNFIN